MTMNYAENVKGGIVAYRPTTYTDRTEQEWHQDGIADTGASHTLPGRLYVVQCLFCDQAFAAHTKAEAMGLFRAHEAEMQKS